MASKANLSNKIREGFIVDEDEEEEERARRRAKRKRSRSERAEELELLDEEDLDLVAEAHGDFDQRPAAKVSDILYR